MFFIKYPLHISPIALVVFVAMMYFFLFVKDFNQCVFVSCCFFVVVFYLFKCVFVFMCCFLICVKFQLLECLYLCVVVLLLICCCFFWFGKMNCGLFPLTIYCNIFDKIIRALIFFHQKTFSDLPFLQFDITTKMIWNKTTIIIWLRVFPSKKTIRQMPFLCYFLLSFFRKMCLCKKLCVFLHIYEASVTISCCHFFWSHI